MESTGVYWIPLYEILEARGLDVVLVNAQHVKNVPGRKSDVVDCQWLQQLHSVGLLRGSFRPTAAIAALRAYLRHRETLVPIHHGLDPGAPGERHQVVIHVNAEVLAEPDQPGQSVLRTGRAFPRERPSGWLRRQPRGRRAAPQHSRIWPCSVAGTTALSTRRATRSIESRMATFSSAGRTGGSCPRFRLLPRCTAIPWRSSERGTTQRDFACTRGRRPRVGWGAPGRGVGDRRLAPLGAVDGSPQ
jgi:hypothetical protein